MKEVEILKGLASKDPKIQENARNAFTEKMKYIIEVIDKVTPEMTAEAYSDLFDLLSKHNIELRFSESAQVKIERNF